MKSKGITIWELHIEKIVLGLAFVAAAYFAATQFIGNPNAATINNQQVSPGKVDELLAEKARRIQALLSPEAPPTLELPEVKPVADEIAAALDSSVSPSDTINLLSYNTVPRVKGIELEAQLYPVPELTAIAPTFPKQYSDALAAEVVSAYPDELAGKFAPGKPYDLTYITFYGELDLAFIREQLQKFREQENPELPPTQIPSTWYGGKPTFADLVIEREELLASGWGNRIVLDPLPGQYSFREWMLEHRSVDDRNYMQEELLKPEIQSAVLQPEFLATRRSSWQPLLIGELIEQEMVDVQVTDEEMELQRLDRIIRKTQQEIARITAQLDALGGPLDEVDTDPSSGGSSPRSSGGGTSPGGGAGKGSGAGLQGRPGGAGDERSKKQRIALTKKLRQYEDRLQRLQDERSEKGGAVLIEEVVDEGPADRIMVWGHDINVEDGKTYRYRMTIKMVNPFFARRLNLKPEQQELADKLTLSSPPSEWSEPMFVNPSVRVFLTGANAATQGRNVQGAGFGSATFQVFKFYDGLMWVDSFVVEPGDRIGGTRRITLRDAEGMSKNFDIDFLTDWLVVDVIQDHEMDGGGALTRNMQAKVVLMDLKTGKITELRSPREDRFSPVRTELLGEVDVSELAALSP